jgi:hypothetical protein
MAPSSRIGEVDERTLPARAGRCPLHVASDRAHHCYDCPRLKLLDGAAEQGLAGEASRTPQWRIEPINGAPADIDQVATGGLKHREEVRIGDGRIDRAK